MTYLPIKREASAASSIDPKDVQFWKRHSADYENFSTICNPTDWEELIKKISETIANFREGHDVHEILDVGAGTGETARRIRGVLNYNYAVPTSWTLLEPDMLLHSHHKRLCSDGNGFAHVRDAVSAMGDLQRIFDLILAVHSTYYLGSPASFLNAFGRVLQSHGVLVIVALSERSPFFLNKSQLLLPNTSTSIQKWVSSSSEWRVVSKLSMKSRAKISFDQFNRPGFLSSLYGFFTQGQVGFDEFRKGMRCFVGSEVDLGDEILVISK